MPLLSLSLLPYQARAKEFILQSNFNAALFLDMGLGKTATVLSAIVHQLTESTDPDSQLGNILVVAPKRVSEVTWPEEVAKWRQFRHIRYTTITGPATEWNRLTDEESLSGSHIHFVGAHNLQRLILHLKATRPSRDIWPFSTVILDESSLFKSRASLRWKELSRLRPYIRHFLLMTGTPAPNGYADLWSQFYLLDGGQRLGTSYRRFEDTYFSKNPYFMWSKPTLRPEAAPIIQNKIKDISVSMDAKDYLDLPPIKYVEVQSTPSPALAKAYRDMREDMVVRLQGSLSTQYIEETITAASAAAVANKLLQLCGGFAYNENKEAVPVDVPNANPKLLALDDIVETAQENNKTILLFYSYQSERDAILQRYDHIGARAINDDKTSSAQTIKDWNDGKIPLLILHPASGGHGLNLQNGGHIAVWYNMTYNLEHWLQGNKRLHRMGQTKQVSVYVLTTKGMLDSHIYKQVLTEKVCLQDTITQALKDVDPQRDYTE